VLGAGCWTILAHVEIEIEIELGQLGHMGIMLGVGLRHDGARDRGFIV
jgi:hypothetical protein